MTESEEDEEERKSSSTSTSTTASDEDQSTQQRWRASVPLLSENPSIFKPASLSVDNLIFDTTGGGGGTGGSKYTSLRDMIDTNYQSPGKATSPSTPRRYHFLEDMPIRNRLVKQAAYSYLQPKSTPGPQSSMRDQSWFGSMRVDDDLGSSNSNGCIGFIRYVFFSAFNGRATRNAGDDATETARSRGD